MMRFVELLYSIPFIFFVIRDGLFGRRDRPICISPSARVTWLDMGAHRPRPDIEHQAQREYIEAAHASGVSQWRS